MKTLKLFSLMTAAMLFNMVSFGQSASETFKVAGNCGMCKTKIEKAATEAGATYASWDTESKELTVKYEKGSSNTARIQQTIAAVGYDTPGFKATDEAYNKLHGCCKYDRAVPATADDCCKPGADCCKDGKCTKHGEKMEKGSLDQHNAKDANCCAGDKCAKVAGTAGCCKKS